jgi:hypothetical protein
MPEKTARPAFKRVRSVERANRNREKIVVDTYTCLASVAQLEFEALVREAQSAIQGLERQRQSTVEAIQAAGRATGHHHGPYALETATHMMALGEKLRRLNAALDQVRCELNGAAAPSRLMPAGQDAYPLPAAPDPDMAVAPSPAPKTLSLVTWSGHRDASPRQGVVVGASNGNGRR